MSYIAKNYCKQGGDELVINGTLKVEASGTLSVEEGATITGLTTVTTTATETDLGLVKAGAKGAGDTVEVKIDPTSSKLYVPTYPVLPVEATTTTAGIVKQAANVPLAAGETPTKEEFDALITALITAGVIAAGE